MDTAPGIEALLAHAEWVRALALSLLRDPARAADLEQDFRFRWLFARPYVLELRGSERRFGPFLPAGDELVLRVP